MLALRTLSSRMLRAPLLTIPQKGVRRPLVHTCVARQFSSSSESLPWEWIPPSNALRDIEEDIEQEEMDAPLTDVTLESRRKRAQKWAAKAEEYMEKDLDLIKVKPGVPLTEDEIVTALEANRAKDINAGFAEDKGMLIICTALSQHHMKKLVTIIYKSMLARELHFPSRTKPFEASPTWVTMLCGNIYVNIMSQEGREFYELDEMLKPGFKEREIEAVRHLLDESRTKAFRIRNRGKKVKSKFFRLTKEALKD